MGALGVFDSGVGGLTVVREIKKIFPDKKIIYFGDTARVPYGTRGDEVIKRFAVEDAKFLESKNVSEIVIACNTVSAVAIDEVRRTTELPVWEMIIPASNAALAASKSGKIGVIGTRGTINSHAYRKLIPDIVEQACPLFVPFVEEGEIAGELVENLTSRYLVFVKDKQIDTLILGCTHYPVLTEVIQKIVGDVKLINCGEEVAKVLKDRHAFDDTQARDDTEDEYYLSDVTVRNVEIAERIMGRKLNVQKAYL